MPTQRKTRRKTILLAAALSLSAFFSLAVLGMETSPVGKRTFALSDHYNGYQFFNPGIQEPSIPGRPPKRGTVSYLWKWMFDDHRPSWPVITDLPPATPPPTRVSEGVIRITPVGHATFLIQMDGVNILTDPIWSERCSPVAWAGPKRSLPPGLRFEDLPPIDLVLVSHNHYDHLDLPTLRRLVHRGTPRVLVPLGNRELVMEAGSWEVEEMDWWETVAIPAGITVTLVPAQHFSSRTPWDRNQALWGGFVVSGPSGNVYFAGDTGYGPHFSEIGRRFQPIRVALLPIAPFKTRRVQDNTPLHFSLVHMGPQEAVQAHLDLRAETSIACHFQVFRLGWEGFEDAPQELEGALKKRGLASDRFLAPRVGQVFEKKPEWVQNNKGEVVGNWAVGGQR